MSAIADTLKHINLIRLGGVDPKLLEVDHEHYTLLWWELIGASTQKKKPESPERGGTLYFCGVQIINKG